MKNQKFEMLNGLILDKIEGEKGSKEIIFHCRDGRKFKLFHYQDCCEIVYVEDICGDLKNLIDYPITMAEEISFNNNECPSEWGKDEYEECFTWTFYKLATVKGYVTIRWYGESNGYYSESVDFCEI